MRSAGAGFASDTRPRFVWILTGVVAAAAVSSGRVGVRAEDRSDGPAPAGFAVLELFTSQGCSSCPPADALLREIDREFAHAPVYPLSFHVDYWNDLGWNDPFSQTAFTDRQRRYARTMGASRVYTPQLVVNGTHHVVGSRAGTVRTWVRNALRGRPATEIQVRLERDGDKLVSRHETRGAPPGSVVVLALSRSEGGNHVPRGENAGRSLQHVRIVKEMRTVGLGGRVTWSVGARRADDDLRVTALVQHRTSGAISAAADTR